MGPKWTIAVTLALASVWLGGGSAAHAAKVQVVRGNMPATIVETREAGVRVFRGTPVTPMIGTASEAPAPSGALDVASGERLWLVDRAAGTLSVCTLVYTTQVGERRIDCDRSQLPQ